MSIWESEAGMSEVYGRFFGTDACWLADGRGISRFDPGAYDVGRPEFRLLYETR